MHRRNILAVIFGILGAILLIYSGVAGSSGFLGWAVILALVLNLGPIFTLILTYLFGILSFLAMLGGWAVLLGCGFVLFGRHRTGSWVIGIGAGMTLFGFLWNILQLWLFGSLNLIQFFESHQGLALIGVIFAIFAQELIRYGKDEN